MLKIEASIRAFLMTIGIIKVKKSEHKKKLIPPELIDNTIAFLLSENDESENDKKE